MQPEGHLGGLFSISEVVYRCMHTYARAGDSLLPPSGAGKLSAAVHIVGLMLTHSPDHTKSVNSGGCSTQIYSSVSHSLLILHRLLRYSPTQEARHLSPHRRVTLKGRHLLFVGNQFYLKRQNLFPPCQVTWHHRKVWKCLSS